MKTRQLLFVFCSCFAALFSAEGAKPDTNMNALLVISPYKSNDMWVFDDPKVGLSREPFVAGADRIMDLLSENIPNAEKGFTLVFSARPFPGSIARFVRDRPEHGGYWYRWPDRSTEGWLCPALFKYFPEAPAEIHVEARPLKRKDSR